MTSFLDQCEELFGTRELYGILGIHKKATNNEVKKGYHKMSLKVHPDRVLETEKDIATRKFQLMSKVYVILSDRDKRGLYDETGEVDDENDVPQDRDWYDYWRLLFAKVSIDDINKYEKQYKGSDEELADLQAAYLECRGDMDAIIESVLCATVDDETRFRKILTKLIKSQELPDYPEFSKETTTKKKARRKKADAEAAEAEEAAKELGMIGGQGSLEALILRNQQSRKAEFGNIIASLEAKYSQEDGSSSRSGKARTGKSRTGKGKKK